MADPLVIVGVIVGGVVIAGACVAILAASGPPPPRRKTHNDRMPAEVCRRARNGGFKAKAHWYSGREDDRD